MKYLLFLTLFCIALPCFAQPIYQPLSATTKASPVIQSVENRFNKDINKLPEKHRKDFKEFYQKRYDKLVFNIKRGLYLQDETVDKYFNTILQNIYKANPAIQFRNIRLLISRSAIPNASCLGEGTIVLNLGLITRLENESQLAFVICHELAHYKKNHVNRAIKKHIATLNSKALQKELKRLDKLEYNKYEQAMALYKSFAYDSNRHSRLHESEADSIGLTYMANTDYDMNEAVKVLEILDIIDEDKYPNPIDFKKHFSSKNYPFKAKWLKKEDLITMDDSALDDGFDADSLKTHPACQKRIVHIERQLKTYNTTNKKIFVQSQEWLSEFIDATDYEIVERAYQSGNLGYCLYYTLQLLGKYPDDIYLNTMVGKCLDEYRLARLDHKGSNYVPVADDSDDVYNQVLRFLNNLRTREIAKVGYSFMTSLKPDFLKQEEFLFYFILHTKAAKKEENAQKLVELYRKQFPNGQFSKEIDAL